MYQFNLKVQGVSGTTKEHLSGLLASYLTVSEEILLNQRKPSVLNFFLRERLTRNDKRVLAIVIHRITSQLLGDKANRLDEDSSSIELTVPEDLASLLSQMSRLSK